MKNRSDARPDSACPGGRGDARSGSARSGGTGDARAASYRYFENRACEYYPCHAIERVNCLFCFCPLYHLADCGGEWTTTDKGAKDCSRCVRPHAEGGYDFVLKRLS